MKAEFFSIAKNLFFTISMFGASLASAQPSAWLEDSIDSSETSIQKLNAADLWIGGAVGLYDNGQAFGKTYGVAQPNNSLAVDPSSSFEIGSVSKSFTGILLALATLELSDVKTTSRLAKFFPEIKNDYVVALTLQQLATHSAGFEDSPSDIEKLTDFDPKNPLGSYSETDLIKYLQTAKPVPQLQRPNQAGQYLRSYSNIGFAVLGLALTRIYGTSFDALIAEKITKPLGMKQTFVSRKNTNLPANMNQGYGISRKPAAFMRLDVFAPAGAIVSTLSDMLKYLAANIEMPSDTLGAAMKLSHDHGFGWDSFPGDQIIMKNGQTYGFSTFISFDPVSKRGSFELHNMYSVFSDWVAALPLSTLAPKTDQIAVNYSQTGFDKLINPISSQFVALAAGTYQNTSPSDTLGDIALIAQQNSLLISIGGIDQGVMLSVQARPDSYWLYQGFGVLGGVSFNRDSVGKPTGLNWTETDENGKIVGTHKFSRYLF